LLRRQTNCTFPVETILGIGEIGELGSAPVLNSSDRPGSQESAVEVSERSDGGVVKADKSVVLDVDTVRIGLVSLDANRAAESQCEGERGSFTWLK
jgi:hypothetical protein